MDEGDEGGREKDGKEESDGEEETVDVDGGPDSSVNA